MLFDGFGDDAFHLLFIELVGSGFNVLLDFFVRETTAGFFVESRGFFDFFDFFFRFADAADLNAEDGSDDVNGQDGPGEDADEKGNAIPEGGATPEDLMDKAIEDDGANAVNHDGTKEPEHDAQDLVLLGLLHENDNRHDGEDEFDNRDERGERTADGLCIGPPNGSKAEEARIRDEAKEIVFDAREETNTDAVLYAVGRDDANRAHNGEKHHANHTENDGKDERMRRFLVLFRHNDVLSLCFNLITCVRFEKEKTRERMAFSLKSQWKSKFLNKNTLGGCLFFTKQTYV